MSVCEWHMSHLHLWKSEGNFWERVSFYIGSEDRNEVAIDLPGKQLPAGPSYWPLGKDLIEDRKTDLSTNKRPKLILSLIAKSRNSMSASFITHYNMYVKSFV